MAFEDITDRSAVKRAIAEFKELGQKAFLKKYDFGPSRGWMLIEDGQEYDAKAILGAAHGYQHSKPLPQGDFHGGAPTARKLRELGFTVTEPATAGRNPVWNRDELILALNLYMLHRPTFPDDKHPEVIELSDFLSRLSASTSITSTATFRNPNGVAMKLQNFRRFDPEQKGKGLPGGGKGEEEVWNTFAGDLARLRKTAAAIRGAVALSETDEDFTLDPDDGEEAEEGRLLTRVHRSRERNRKIVEKRKAKALRDHGALRCEACEFDFSTRYGDRGAGFIECHHTKPVSALEPGAKTRLEDLALLCANCHRMIHVRRPWLTVEELRSNLQPKV